LTIAGHSLQYTGSELLGENLSGRQQMIALNVLLMIVVVALIAFALAWAIVSDRRSKRARGGAVSSPDARLHHNLEMPREMLRARRFGRTPDRRKRGSRTPMS
jgi:hypothetical protein